MSVPIQPAAPRRLRWFALLPALASWLLLAGWAASASANPSAEQAASSIWPRVVAGMRLGGENRPEVKRFIAHYAAHPAQLQTMLARAEPFLWYVVRATEARTLPTELALLPAVESGWNPQAVSVSSAHGLWQFIPKTGDAYGLRDALNYAARRDPVASTDAALRLLAELHGEYRDWPLALAAYNTGGVRLKQTMKRAGSRNYWRLPLPQVTRDYVPRLLAIAALVRDPARYGVTLPAIADAGVAEVIALEPDAPLHLALTAAAVDAEVLRLFNPALVEHGAPTHSPTLLLPPADALALRAELASLRVPAIEPPLNDAPVVEPLDEASAAHHGTALQPPRVATRLHWDQRMRQLPVAAPGEPRQHRVKAGETLFSIAQRHGQSAASLRHLNALSPSALLRPGQLIKLNSCGRSRCG